MDFVLGCEGGSLPSTRRGQGRKAFNSGLWNHAAATASGGSQILGTNRYRIYSSAGAISQVQVAGVLTAGRAYQFQLTFETPVLGTQIQVGDAGANTDDFVSSLAGTRTVAFVADGTTATLKRPYVVNAGQPTDVVVKNIAVTDITATALNITSQPQSRSIVDGNTTTFSVTVSAPFTAIHYQWEVSTNGGVSWATYTGGSGATTASLTTAAMTTADNGELFRCRVRMGSANNATGQIYSNAATLTVTAANANPVAPTLALGDLTLGTGYVKSSGELLAGATDADGDTLTITGVSAVSGGEVVGTGPYVITPTAEGAGSATVAISDGRGGSVNRTVTWNGVAAGVSGGTAALAWSAPDLNDGSVVTLTTDGTYDFGSAPTAIAQLGFGRGWLYTQPLLTVAETSVNMDGIVVSEGGCRRIETVDGIRVLASRLLDPAGWAGNTGAGRNLSYDLGTVGAGTKFATFQTYKTVSQVAPLNWQFKNVRIQTDPDTTDGRRGLASFSWRNNNYIIYMSKDLAASSFYNTVQPHANYGWQAYGVQFEYSNQDVADGEHRTLLCRENDPLGVQARSQLILSNESGGLPAKYVVWQDYWDNSSGTAYEPANLDQYITDIQVQKDAWGVVMLADGPTPSTSRNATFQPTLADSVIAWSNDEIQFRIWKQAKPWPVGFYHVYNGDTGAFTASVPAWGTYVAPEYNWLTDRVGLYRPTVNASAGLRLTNTALDPSAEDYVDYYIAFRKESDVPATVTANSLLCRGTANSYRSIAELKTDGSLNLRSEGNHLLVLCPAGTYPAPNGADCRWRLRMPKAAVGGIPELWDEKTQTRIDAGNAFPAGWDKWIPTHWFIAGGSPTMAINGTLYNVKAVGAQSGTLYDFRLNQAAGTPVQTPVLSAHDESVTATVLGTASLSYVDHST